MLIKLKHVLTSRVIPIGYVSNRQRQIGGEESEYREVVMERIGIALRYDAAGMSSILQAMESIGGEIGGKEPSPRLEDIRHVDQASLYRIDSNMSEHR